MNSVFNSKWSLSSSEKGSFCKENKTSRDILEHKILHIDEVFAVFLSGDHK